MRHETCKFEIKNAVIIYDKNAKESCPNKKGVKLYKIWVAARKSDLQRVFDVAFTKEELFGYDTFEFCQAIPASTKVKRNLRLAGYENTDDFYTFYVSKWNEPIDVNEDMLFQEVNLECFIPYTERVVKDENGHCKRTSTGAYETIPGGDFVMRKTHKITLDDSVDPADPTDSVDAGDKYTPAHEE